MWVDLHADAKRDRSCTSTCRTRSSGAMALRGSVGGRCSLIRSANELRSAAKIASTLARNLFPPA